MRCPKPISILEDKGFLRPESILDLVQCNILCTTTSKILGFRITKDRGCLNLGYMQILYSKINL